MASSTVRGDTAVGKSHRRSRGWRILETLAWTTSLACLAVWAGLSLTGSISAHRDVAQFVAWQQGASPDPSHPDLSLWSPKRIQAWQDAQKTPAPAALAVLRIRRLGIEVPVLEGTDDWTLNRAVGHIEDTANPGTIGNVGIAGHRDGFFRALKDIAPGDALELATKGGTERYRIERVWIVDPDDVSVIAPMPTRAVTLVTCYPFYFIGSAPQRFIVRAVPVARSES